jgi:two-component system, OmpR family, sensor kinase
MSPIRRLGNIPVSFRVPLVVALMMVVISAIISERVLDRLERTQEAYLNGLAESYLDGVSSAVIPAVLRADVWEVFDALDRSASAYKALSPEMTVVTGPDGEVLAASDPDEIPPYSRLPEQFSSRYGPGAVTILESASMAFARRDLTHQGQSIGVIHAAFDVSHLFEERREVLVTLLVTNAILAALFALGGFLVMRRVIGPIRVLERHMRSAALGDAQPIPPSEIPTVDGEVAGLFHGYNALVKAEREREDLAVRLAEEEKLASLGRLASGMAHEINNPLGGLINAVDTLKAHGQTPGVREASISLVERGLAGIRQVVEAALATYRPERSRRPLARDDLEDVRLLLQPELRRKRQRLDWDISWMAGREFAIEGGPIRQAVLNLLLNASAATPEGGLIWLKAAGTDSGWLEIGIGDGGPGMPPEIARALADDDPVTATRAGRGLGLWMVRRVALELGGHVAVARNETGGTTITLSLPLAEEKEEQHHAA